MKLLEPLEFRDGRVLAFPGHITELAYARVGKPRTILLVYEIPAGQDRASLEKGDVFFASIGLLPTHSYWRDNLPPTNRHGILGGQRYVFRGKHMEAAEKVAKAYTSTFGQAMPGRLQREGEAVVDALSCQVAILQEDAVRHILSSHPLIVHLTPTATAKLGEFLKSDAPARHRTGLARALGRAGVRGLADTLESLAAGDDPVAAGALEGLDGLGEPRSTKRLGQLSSAKTVEVRAYAARVLGSRSGADAEARAKAVAILDGDDEDLVRVSAAIGMGSAASEATVEPLKRALYRGDEVSLSAALALAEVGSSEVARLLMNAVTDGHNQTMAAAVTGIVTFKVVCEGCYEFLAEQHRSHKQQSVRDLIATLMELNRKDLH
ncbi:MAG: hypothetical protein VCA74_01700 [Deltaproteobacteria bacterium]